MKYARTPILVTGFGPFPGQPRNVSSLLAEAIAKEGARRLPGFEIHAITVPTEWQAAPQLLNELVAKLQPAVAIHFGVSHRARGFVVETRAHNERDDVLDACGAGPEAQCVYEGGPDQLGATLPTGLIVERLRRLGLPVQLSRDAGGYLCNALLYHSLHAARRDGRDGITPRRGFIHIPDRLAPGRFAGGRRASISLLDWESAVGGGIEILATSAGVVWR